MRLEERFPHVEGAAGSVSQSWVCRGSLTSSSAGVEPVGTSRVRGGEQVLRSWLRELQLLGSAALPNVPIVLNAVPLLHFCHQAYGVGYLVPQDTVRIKGDNAVSLCGYMNWFDSKGGIP